MPSGAAPIALRSLLPLATATPAHAGGSSMPWEAPLQSILESIEGPVAKIVAVIIIIVTGLSLAFGDTSGGSLFAGLFLQRFVGQVSDDPDAPRIPWVHLDIAGSGTAKAPFGATDKGPTAATVRSLVALLEEAAR